MNATRSPSEGTSWSDYGERRLELKRLAGLLGPSVRLVWRASPSETVTLLVLQVLTGLALPAQVLAGKWALDEVLAASRSDAGMESALPAVGVAVATLTIGRLVFTASIQRQRLLPELVGQTAMTMLARKAVTLDLVALETPAFHDRLVRAQEQAAFRPANMVRDLGAIVTSGVAVVGLGIVLVTVHPALVLLLVAGVVPLWSTSISGGRAFYRHMVHNTPNRRLISYLRGICTVRDSAKEARAFGLGPYLLEKQQGLFEEQTDELRRLIAQRLRRELLSSFASSLVNAAGLLIVLWLHFSGRISIGELAAGVGALLLVVPRLGLLVSATGRPP